MQRSIAIFLSAMFTWLVIMPLLLPSGESVLPACCRKSGKHHCMMMTVEAEYDSGPAFSTIKEKCPCFPASGVSTQPHASTVILSAAIFAGWVRHPAISPQVEAGYRISHDRARQKRGPPSSILA